jgi:hypothetical protein
MQINTPTLKRGSRTCFGVRLANFMADTCFAADIHSFSRTPHKQFHSLQLHETQEANSVWFHGQ